MNDNKVTLIGVVFLLICVGIGWGIFYVNGQLKILVEQYQDLEQRRVNLEKDAMNLKEQVSVFRSAFSSLENYNVRATSNDMDFYSQVQQEIQNKNDVNIITSRQMGVKDGRSSIALKLRGDYYSFMKILAAWRNLTTTVRVAQLSVMASKTPAEAREIEADVVLEAIVSAR